VRIGRVMRRLITAGYRPRQDIVPFIEWDPREFNSLADHAANCALDLNDSWSRWDHNPGTVVDKSKIRLCVDGALRGDGRASAGMAVLFCGGDAQWRCIYRAGTTLGQMSSAFAAEVLSMDWALDILVHTIL
jgi:hypothetical protein